MIKPWYKQFWPWFLILLPTSVVIASFSTLYVFSKNSVSLVAEDYYKKGKGINVDLSKMKAAKSLSLTASVVSENNSIVVQFDKGDLEFYPALNITFSHRTLADKDFSKTVSSDAKGRYRIMMGEKMTGPWFVEVQPHSKDWLIQGKVTFPSDEPTILDN